MIFPETLLNYLRNVKTYARQCQTMQKGNIEMRDFGRHSTHRIRQIDLHRNPFSLALAKLECNYINTFVLFRCVKVPLFEEAFGSGGLNIRFHILNCSNLLLVSIFSAIAFFGVGHVSTFCLIFRDSLSMYYLNYWSSLDQIIRRYFHIFCVLWKTPASVDVLWFTHVFQVTWQHGDWNRHSFINLLILFSNNGWHFLFS